MKDRATPKKWTYGTDETTPTPFPTKGFNSLVVISDRSLTPLALRKAKSDMTGFAIRVPFVDSEALEISVPA
jgi:hypothetical protein